MAEIGFYHLTRTGADAALPVLLGRTLSAGERAAVMCGSEERVAALDTALWVCPEPDWLPHGTPASGNGPMQPIWLATDDTAPNGARFLFLIDGCTSTRLDAFLRVFDLFDGRDDDAVDRDGHCSRIDGDGRCAQRGGRGWRGWRRRRHGRASARQRCVPQLLHDSPSPSGSARVFLPRLPHPARRAPLSIAIHFEFNLKRTPYK